MNRIVKWAEIQTKDLETLIDESTKGIMKSIDSIAVDIYSHNDIKLVFVSGPSSSGKTSYANLLEEKLERMGLKGHTLSLDNFFLNRADIPFIKENVRDYDSINALDLELIHKTFENLIKIGYASIPRFDFLHGVRSKEWSTLYAGENDVVIIEGIHSFNPLIQVDINENNYLNIYVEPMTDVLMNDGYILDHKLIRLIRRMTRDMFTRGHSIESTMRQWAHVRMSEDINIYPYKHLADYQIDTFAEYELGIYRQLLLPKLDREREELQYFINILKHIEPLDPIMVPEKSIISEFSHFNISI